MLYKTNSYKGDSSNRIILFDESQNLRNQISPSIAIIPRSLSDLEVHQKSNNLEHDIIYRRRAGSNFFYTT